MLDASIGARDSLKQEENFAVLSNIEVSSQTTRMVLLQVYFKMEPVVGNTLYLRRSITYSVLDRDAGCVLCISCCDGASLGEILTLASEV